MTTSGCCVVDLYMLFKFNKLARISEPNGKGD